MYRTYIRVNGEVIEAATRGFNLDPGDGWVEVEDSIAVARFAGERFWFDGTTPVTKTKIKVRASRDEAAADGVEEIEITVDPPVTVPLQVGDQLIELNASESLTLTWDTPTLVSVSVGESRYTGTPIMVRFV